MSSSDPSGSLKDLVDLLSRHLLKAHAEGKRIVLVVDEAQNLAPEVLEQVRLLTNLETETQKLLQIILIGQPELRELLDRTELRQLAQRITGRYHLDPLSSDETAAYVRHRLRVAGATRDVFANGALREIIACRAACRASSTSSATAPCSAHSPRTATWLAPAWCVAPRVKCSARPSSRAGCRGQPDRRLRRWPSPAWGSSCPAFFAAGRASAAAGCRSAPAPAPAPARTAGISICC